uniref:Uncharacterized protein n=1 Tax=Arundo donax TaxID=35708 RepID=A0A0A9BXK1_ARUDO
MYVRHISKDISDVHMTNIAIKDHPTPFPCNHGCLAWFKTSDPNSNLAT